MRDERDVRVRGLRCDVRMRVTDGRCDGGDDGGGGSGRMQSKKKQRRDVGKRFCDGFACVQLNFLRLYFARRWLVADTLRRSKQKWPCRGWQEADGRWPSLSWSVASSIPGKGARLVAFSLPCLTYRSSPHLVEHFDPKQGMAADVLGWCWIDSYVLLRLPRLITRMSCWQGLPRLPRDRRPGGRRLPRW